MMCPANISPNLFGQWVLSYQSFLVKELHIKELLFEDIDKLYQFLQNHICRELTQAVYGFISWRTGNFQYIPISGEKLSAMELLKQAPSGLKGLNLQECCHYILDKLIQPMIDSLPKKDAKTYHTALGKIEALESYCTELLSNQTINVCKQPRYKAL